MVEEVVQITETMEKKVAPKKAAKVLKQVSQGRVYVQATYNNTLVTVTDAHGNVLAWSSSGHMGFRGPKKATPYAATQVVRELSDKVRPMGLRDVHIFVKGVGSGREAAVRAWNAQGFTVLSIKDVTPIPHNGCRRPGPRRI